MPEKLRRIHTLTLRKHKMEEKRQITRTKIAASRSFSGGVVLATPSKLARIRPEWVFRRNSVKEMHDPMAAVNFLLTSLQLAPK